MPRQIKAGLFFAIIGFLFGYVLATGYLGVRYNRDVGLDYLALNTLDLFRYDQNIFVHCMTIVGCSVLLSATFGAHYATERLTTHGTSDWQSKREMRRNGLLGEPGTGFVLAKTSLPGKKGEYITSDKHPNCLVVAPTGSGKGVGFVYPNLFTFEGSTVTLDIKGENFDTTAKWRAAQGDKVFKFAPAEFDQLSHRYNPLDRIGKIKSYAQRSFETRKIATLFLQADALDTWLNGAVQLFTVGGGIAHQRGDFTLGGIYKVLAGGQTDMKSHLTDLADEASDPALKRELNGMSILREGALASYKSVMDNAGFDLWANPHIAKMTSESDFTFDDLRRKCTSIYFIVKDGDIAPMAGLVRLFFNELVTTLQQAKPGEDEPHPVMIILDEFHLLGKMDRVANAMTTIRGFNGRIALITQTIPALDVIYSREARLSIQGGAGLKLYMTPSEELTIEDLSNACGMTTKSVTSRSDRMGLGEKATFSTRTEERPLLTKDEARRLDENASIIIVNGRQPVKVKRIVHYADRTFANILKETKQLSWSVINDDLMQRALRRAEAAETDTVGSTAAATVDLPTSLDTTGTAVTEKLKQSVEMPKDRVADLPRTIDDLALVRSLADQVIHIIEQGIRPLPEKSVGSAALDNENKRSKDTKKISVETLGKASSETPSPLPASSPSHEAAALRSDRLSQSDPDRVKGL